MRPRLNTDYIRTTLKRNHSLIIMELITFRNLSLSSHSMERPQHLKLTNKYKT